MILQQNWARGFACGGKTTGKSKQRTTWFMAGLKSGALDRCNTFAPGAVGAN